MNMYSTPGVLVRIGILLGCCGVFFAASGQTSPDWRWIRSANTGVAGEQHTFLTSDPAGNVWTGGRSILFTSEGSVVRIEAADEVFTCWSDFEGYLPGSVVNGAVSTPEGELWVGTDAGLARSTSAGWVHYTTANTALPSHHIRHVALGADGSMWCAFHETNASIGGIASFDGEAWTVHTPANSGLPAHTCRRVLPAPDGKVWVVTELAVSLLDDGQWTTFDWTNSTIAGWGITDAALDDDGALHVVTGGWAWSDEVAVYSENGWATVGPEQAPWLAGSTVLDVFHRNGRSIYTVSGPVGVAVVTVEQDGSWQQHPAGEYIFDVHIDFEGNFWAASMSSVSRLTPAGWKDYTRYNIGLAEDLNSNLFIDSAQRLWTANGNGGIQVFDCPRWESYGPWNEGLFPSPQTLSTVGASICESSTGDVWFAFNSTSGTAVRIPGGNTSDTAAWEVFDGSNSPVSWVTECIADGFGNVFFYSDYGTHMWNGATGSWTTWDLTTSPLQYYSYGFARDHLGRACFGGFQQIAMYDGSAPEAPWSVVYLADLGAPNLTSVNDLAYEADGTLWLATPEGVSRWENEVWTHWTPSNSNLAALHMNGIELDAAGVAYACGYDADGWITGGVSILHPDSSDWTTWTTENSDLPAEQLDDLQVDNSGNLWINAYPRGIAVYRQGGVIGLDCWDTGLDTWTVSEVEESGLPDSSWVHPNPCTRTNLRITVTGRGPGSIEIRGVNGTCYLEIPYTGPGTYPIALPDSVPAGLLLAFVVGREETQMHRVVVLP